MPPALCGQVHSVDAGKQYVTLLVLYPKTIICILCLGRNTAQAGATALGALLAELTA
jgi:hypothetical protein